MQIAFYFSEVHPKYNGLYCYKLVMKLYFMLL